MKLYTLSVLFVAVSLFAGWLEPSEPARLVQILSERKLPDLATGAADIRWADDDSVFLAILDQGLLQIPLFLDSEQARLWIKGGRSEEIWRPSKVGVSPRYLVAGSSLLSVVWKQRGRTELAGGEAFEFGVDLDVQDNRLLILGARREAGKMSPDGAIAWIGSLDQDLRDLKAVYFSRSGPGAKSMNTCGWMDSGAVRFLEDGSFVIVPGIEPGIYLYDKTGKLVRTWDTAELGLDAECDTESDSAENYAVMPLLRDSWVNARRIVDDVLPLREGIALLVRTAREKGVEWQIKLLRWNGKVEDHPLPVTSPSRLARLRGDVRGDRVVLLETGRGKNHPERLFVGRVEP